MLARLAPMELQLENCLQLYLLHDGCVHGANNKHTAIIATTALLSMRKLRSAAGHQAALLHVWIATACRMITCVSVIRA